VIRLYFFLHAGDQQACHLLTYHYNILTSNTCKANQLAQNDHFDSLLIFTGAIADIHI